MPFQWPTRDKQQDPFVPCDICGAEVYTLPEGLLDSVICEQCAKELEGNDE